MEERKTAGRLSPEVWERAVRLVRDHEESYGSQWAAMCSIAGKIGCSPETLRNWVRQAVRDAIAAVITTLPEQLRRSLTWDQGAEMAKHAELCVKTGLSVFFCDPHSPWQRGSNENTNGLLRQYFPKGTDLATHDPDDLAAAAHALKTRPRKTLGWRTPAEALDEILQSAQKDHVATTG